MIFAIITMFSFLCICILYVFARLSLLNNCNENSRKIVIPANFMCSVGIVCGLIFSIPIIFCFVTREQTWVIVGFSCFLWLAIYLIYVWLGSVIVYDKEGFTIGYLPWQRKYYRYGELTSTKMTNRGRILFCDKKRIVLDHMLIEDYCFEVYAMKKYKEIWGKDLAYNKTIPKWDIFKGHVDSPEEMIFVGVLLFVITLALPIWFTYEAFDDVTENETISMEVQFTSYEIDNQTLLLKATNHVEEFELWNYEKYDSVFSNIITALEDNQQFKINVLILEEDNDEPIRYEIYNMRDMNGNNILSFDEVNRISNKNSLEIALFTLIFFFMWLGFCIGTVIVGRNPQKFSKRIQKLFFKEECLRY